MVEPWIGSVVRASIASFVHTSVPLMILEYAHLPPATAAAVHFVLLVSSVTARLWFVGSTCLVQAFLQQAADPGVSW
jgi:hypothetical protein